MQKAKTSPRPAWEHYPHEADMGIRAYGATLAEAFENAALAMVAIITDLPSIEAATPVSLHCEAPDRELLLVDFLNTVITEMSVRKMLFSRFQVDCNATSLQAVAWGEPVDQEKHHPAVEVKGATYTDLQVRQLPDSRWVVQCVVDV